MDYRALLDGVRTMAVVGISKEPTKAGYFVPEYLHRAGYRIIPVNPKVDAAWGESGYANLREIPDAVELVLVFRKAEYCPDVVRDALAMTHPPRIIWLQSGIISPESRHLAEDAGLIYVENRCLMVEHRRAAA
jgi:predicted CoA-binding protein